MGIGNAEQYCLIGHDRCETDFEYIVVQCATELHPKERRKTPFTQQSRVALNRILVAARYRIGAIARVLLQNDTLMHGAAESAALAGSTKGSRHSSANDTGIARPKPVIFFRAECRHSTLPRLAANHEYRLSASCSRSPAPRPPRARHRTGR